MTKWKRRMTTPQSNRNKRRRMEKMKRMEKLKKMKKNLRTTTLMIMTMISAMMTHPCRRTRNRSTGNYPKRKSRMKQRTTG
jgi:hypothetical protein